MEYAQFFEKATKSRPFPYQERMATVPALPSLVHAPTGAGKTAAAVLAWLWRRRHADEAIKAQTPRRLVYCLPMRVLVEQTRDEVKKWLTNLDEKVAVHLLMGGEEADEWDLYPERKAVLIGTQDMLLSRALNRGYGMSRYRWPMHYALLNNDCLWVMDEIQLMGSGLATSTQLQAFRDGFKTHGQTQTVWMSATLRRDWLDSVDFRERVGALTVLGLEKPDLAFGGLKERYFAHKSLAMAGANADQPDALGQTILAEHQRHKGSLTLVVVNTVERARNLFEALGAAGKSKRVRGKQAPQDGERPDLLLIHSRFRPIERRKQIQTLTGKEMPEAGRIVVATQVIEAGVDISARTMFTELAPWASLVQRFGRCNRRGEYDDARAFWIDVPSAGKKSLAPPYDEAEMDAARSALQTGLSDVGPSALQHYLDPLPEQDKKNLFPYEPAQVIRRKDFVELFDTTPDLAGNDVDVSRFIRDRDELDVQVFWREGPPSSTMAKVEAKQAAPRREELCPVKFHALREFLSKKEKTAFRWDALEGRWKKAPADAVFPGQVYWLAADQGGYHLEKGWDPKESGRVTPHAPPPQTPPPEGLADDRWSHQAWQTIAEHTDDVTRETLALCAAIGLDGEWRLVMEAAARWHDWGKAHPTFQDAVRNESEGKGVRPADKQAWRDVAKAPDEFWRHYERKHFRHELASSLAVLRMGESIPELAALRADQRDLVAYLIAAHHGKVRLSIRSMPNETVPEDERVRFARGVWDDDELPSVNLGSGVTAPLVKLDLGPMELGLTASGQPSWAERVLLLRETLGPLRLAFLESLLRASDMRASAEADRRAREKNDA